METASHGRSRRAVRIVGLALAVVLLAFALRDIEFSRLGHALLRVPLAEVAGLALLLIGNLAIAGARLHIALGDFGYRVGWLDSMRVSLVSLLGGTVFFQLVGQTLSRVAMLKQAGVSGAATVLITLYERAVSMGILVLAAGISGALLFGRLSLDLAHGGDDLMRLATYLLLAILFAAAFGFANRVGQVFGWLVNLKSGLRLARMILITVAQQGAMLLAYVVLAVPLAGDVPLDHIVAASTIVMFVAALPISFGGWGLRELSAVYAYGAIGVGTSEALVIAVVIGLLSQAILLGLTALATMTDVVGARNGHASAAGDGGATIRYRRLLAVALPLAAAVAVLFQVRVPIGTGQLNVNIADPLVMVGGLACLAFWARSRARVRWQVAGFETLLAVFGLVLLAGFVHGVVGFGVTDWALYNRLIGFVILSAYALTGALCVAEMGEGARADVPRTFVAALAAVLVGGILLRFAYAAGFDFGVPEPRFEGMAGNANAFGFQAVMALAVWLALPRLGFGTRRFQSKVPILLAALVLAAIWLSGSRASVGTAFGLAAMALAMRTIGIRTLGAAILLAAVPVGIVYVLQQPQMLFDLPDLISPKGVRFRPHAPGEIFGWRTYSDGSDQERWLSVSRSIEMWREHPLFGAGLGAFNAQSVRESGGSLVIHSSPAWLLAEFGIAGLAAVGAAALAFAWRLFAWWRRSGTWTAALAILLCAAMAAEFAVHDMLYQRSFWFLLGVVLALPVARRAGGEGDDALAVEFPDARAVRGTETERA